MTAKETAEKKMNGYKRLGFVSDYTTFAWTKSTDIASSVYDYSKGFMPKSLSPTVEHWEKKVSEIGSPLLAKLHDNSDYMLHAVDDTVGFCRLRPLHPPLPIAVYRLLSRIPGGFAPAPRKYLGVDGRKGVPFVKRLTIAGGLLQLPYE